MEQLAQHLAREQPGLKLSSYLKIGNKCVCLAMLRTCTNHCKPGGYARRGGWAGVSATACGSKGSDQKTISYSDFLSAGGKQGMNVMKWVQGHGRLLLHLYLIPLVSLCDPCPGISCAAESCKAWGSWYLLLQAAAEGALFLPCSTLLPSCLCTGSHRSSSTWPQTWLLDGSENSANFTALLGTWHQVQGRAGPPFAGAVCSENR